MFERILNFFYKNKFPLNEIYDSAKVENILRKIENLTGIKPKNQEYFLKAFTHRSYLELTSQNIKSNERLEFLGDSVLNKISAEYLFNKYPNADEGFLTKSRSQIVNKISLEKISFNLKLQDYIFLNEKYLSKEQKKIGNAMADCLEALIAAIYLEFGENVVNSFVKKHIIIPLIESGNIKYDNNFKGQLLEYSHANKLNQPVYTVLEQSGPQHNKIYKIQVFISENIFGIGFGPNKKSAEQEAAKNALSLINSSFDNNE
jgi:ribonuclease III